MTRRPVRRRPAEPVRRLGEGPVALFGEMLVAGIAVAGVSLAVVTVVPALAAGTQHIERHLSGRSDALRELFATMSAAFRGVWAATLVPVAAIAFLIVNVSLGIRGLVPGGGVLAAVSAVLAAAVAIVTCRAAALWSPGARWPELLRDGRALALSDPIGSVFVLLGLAVSVTVTWMFAPLIVIAPGMLALSLVAAERRRASAAGNDVRGR